MGSPDLTLDFCLSSKTRAPKSTPAFLAEVSKVQNKHDKIAKLDEYVNRLQDEMKKIDAFKRELPLCMLLLNDAITNMKEELRNANAEPVMEEFIPLKKSTSDEKDGPQEKENNNICRDKMNWMSSVQLWSSDNLDYKFSTSKPDNNKKRKEEAVNRPLMDDLFRSSKNRTEKGAFAPFKGCRDFPVMMKIGTENRDEAPVLPALSLHTPEIKISSKDEIHSGGLSSKSSSSRSGSSSATNDDSSFKAQQQQIGRKQRRCWSPELHRRFVSALEHLGGAQVATPKQIRELMQVDGLTNDEVKSHLQKYRLHSRKVPPPTNTNNNSSTSLVGGLWMSQEECGESSKQSNSHSGSPQGPLHLTEETEDDEKSESHVSWKSHNQFSERA